MLKSASLALIFTGFFILSACAPKGPSSLRNKTQTKPQELNFEQPAEPTFKMPETKSDEIPFQAPPAVIKTKDNHEVIIGHSATTGATVRYSSRDSDLNITGTASIFDEKKNLIVQKNFNLNGKHAENQIIFPLVDFNDQNNPDLIVRAKATCMGMNNNFESDCSHIVVDIFMSYKGRYFTDQIEAKSQADNSRRPANPKPTDEYGPGERPEKPSTPPQSKPQPSPTPERQNPPSQPTPQPQQPSAPPASKPEVEASPEEDQKVLQSEDSDQSADGRYQGTIGIVDIEDLFKKTPELTPQPAPISPTPPQPKQPSLPQQSPKVAPKPDKPTAPPATQKPQEPEQSAEPKASQPENTTLDKILSADLLQTREGTVRAYNQAFGFPNEGRLRNATSLLTKQQTLGSKAFFEVVSPDRKKHFATYEMAELVTRLGDFKKEKWEKKLFVSNSSLLNGGPVRPHASHQIGNDVDLAYPTDKPGIKFPLVVTMKPRKFYSQNYSTEKTYKTFKYLFEQKDIVVERIFVDQAIRGELCEYAKQQNEFAGENAALVRKMFENLQHVDGHGDHYHLRIRCSSYDPGCRTRIYRKMSPCPGT